jgi:hypothetical protein
MVSKLVKKNLDSPDEIISSEKIELANLDGFSIARVTLNRDGARKKYVKPQEKTNCCKVAHT